MTVFSLIAEIYEKDELVGPVMLVAKLELVIPCETGDDSERLAHVPASSATIGPSV
jgi:hypothetical protein